jgi:MtrB/PioB family decaheme-associated outer membrane protein
MRRKLVAVVVAGLFAGSPAWGADDNQDPFSWAGSVELGGRGTDTEGGERNGAYGTSATTVQPFTGPRDAAKAQEYQDPSSGVIGVIDIRGGNRGYYLRGFGENFGRDDQYINVVGGGYGMFKAQVFSDRMPHNLSWNALTPLTSTGTALQLGPGGAYPPATNPGNWNYFDYGIQRNTIGGNLEVSAKSPWFVRADYNEVTTTGIRPGSAQLGTGSGNGLIEFGVPTDFKTQNSVLEAGYAASTWNVKLAYLSSKFSSGIQTSQWSNFYMLNALDTTLIAPDNDLQKWSLSASVRALPLDSNLLVRVTQSKLTNSIDVAGGGLKPTGNQAPPIGVGTLVTTPSASTFDGEHTTTTATVALASTLMKGLETRIYYEYYDKANDSTQIDYAGGGLGSAANTCPGANNANRFCIAPLLAGELFSYTKNTIGLEANYRIDGRQKVLAGYNYLKVERTFEVAEESRDQRFWIEYRNSKIANLSGRLKYQFLNRDSDINHSFTDSGTATPAQVQYYYSAYDVANFDQNMVKLTLDWNPLSLLTVGFGATWKQTDFKNLEYYGRTDDTSNLYDLTISYGDPDTFRITALGNWGEVKFNQAYHQGTGPTPGLPQTPTDFNWGTENTQSNWMVALMADWVASEKVKLTSSVSYQKTGGGVDFWSGNTAGTGGFNGGPLVNYVTDNTKMFRFNLSGTYIVNSNWSVNAGYWYQKYDYSDDQMRGYQSYYGYYQNLGGTNNSWNSGAFANPSYTQNIFYLTAVYKFGK